MITILNLNTAGCLNYSLKTKKNELTTQTMTHRLLIFTGLVAHIPVGRVFHHALLGAFYIFRRRYSSFLQENKISFMENTYLCNAL